jgi:hypothetical protein
VSSQLLLETAGHTGLLIVALCIAAGAKALASVLRTWVQEASRTHRFNKALEDSSPIERPEIIVACSQLEGQHAAEPGPDTAVGRLPAHTRLQPSALIPQSNHHHESHED